MSALLVTGTDTGVGKTLVTAMCAAAMAARGLRVAVAKPVETGCRATTGGLYPEDAAALAAAAGNGTAPDIVCRHRFADPVAPLVAAERTGAPIDVAALVADLRARAATADVLLIEGAGGLLVPITHATTFVDLAAALDAPVLVVVGSRLGAINHALLTFEVLASRGVALRGWVLNRLGAEADLAVATNGGVLHTMARGPCVGEVPWLADAAALLAALRGETGDAAAAAARLASLAETHLALADLLP